MIPEDELRIFDKYFLNYQRVEVPILIDATKDKIKAVTYVMDKDALVGQPSDDYIKAMLKHLKFFWDQGGAANLTLENFGISLPELEKKEVKKSAEPAVTTVETVTSKSKKRAKT